MKRQRGCWANRALEILGDAAWEYARVSRLDDIKSAPVDERHVSTRCGWRRSGFLHSWRRCVGALQESISSGRSGVFAHVVKVGADRVSGCGADHAGREMSAYAEAVNRDRGAFTSCEERLAGVNLAGRRSAPGWVRRASLSFPRREQLRALTGDWIRARGEPGGGDAECGCICGGLGDSASARVSLIKIWHGPAACCPSGAGTLGWGRLPAGAAGGLVDYARGR